ncbi:MAG: hypothetical protein HXY41_05410 [Chloroflexi bacterium]|nr:hypothetical protein [Chloroflexota bacterium]
MNAGRRLVDALWLVLPPATLTVRAAPVECVKALALAARPSQQRLHLRNLFAEGRRYYLQPIEGGFRLTCNSKIPWRRGRTTIAALLLGHFSDAGDGVTRLDLRARMRMIFLLDIFFIPSFITSLLVFAPWPPWLILTLALTLYGLSWTWHRLTAALQAEEMLFFVQKALEDLSPYHTPALSASTPEQVTPEFREEWDKFYRKNKNNDTV